MLGRRRDVDVKRRAGQCLAIGAVADIERIGIDLRHESDRPAMAMSVDFHAGFLVRSPANFMGMFSSRP